MKHLLFACLCAASIFSFSSCDEKKSTEPANYVEFVNLPAGGYSNSGSISNGTGELDVYGKIKNISGRRQEFRWRLSDLSNAPAWQAYYVCDKVCNQDNVNTMNFTLDANEEQDISFHFKLGGTPSTGTSSAKITIFPVNDESKSISTTFTVIGNR